ncbi:uncharacterized protein LOC134462660 [Engraulis encrasicolus]|uniref:uncharacterized protein LOC134462660 n=1 Tax=Engraulis encrasicolus TaxID=184585 RepID=UPI002FD172D4
MPPQHPYWYKSQPLPSSASLLVQVSASALLSIPTGTSLSLCPPQHPYWYKSQPLPSSAYILSAHSPAVPTTLFHLLLTIHTVSTAVPSSAAQTVIALSRPLPRTPNCGLHLYCQPIHLLLPPRVIFCCSTVLCTLVCSPNSHCPVSAYTQTSCYLCPVMGLHPQPKRSLMQHPGLCPRQQPKRSSPCLSFYPGLPTAVCISTLSPLTCCSHHLVSSSVDHSYCFHGCALVSSPNGHRPVSASTQDSQLRSASLLSAHSPAVATTCHLLLFDSTVHPRLQPKQSLPCLGLYPNQLLPLPSDGPSSAAKTKSHAAPRTVPSSAAQTVIALSQLLPRSPNCGLHLYSQPTHLLFPPPCFIFCCPNGHRPVSASTQTSCYSAQ